MLFNGKGWLLSTWEYSFFFLTSHSNTDNIVAYFLIIVVPMHGIDLSPLHIL